MKSDPLLDFKSFPFSHLGQEWTVYRKGTGPAVIVMHEVPGISVEVIPFPGRWWTTASRFRVQRAKIQPNILRR